MRSIQIVLFRVEFGKKVRVLEGYFSSILESGFLEYLRMYFGMRADRRAVQCISVNLSSNIIRSER